MFTGIVETIGTIKNISAQGLEISAELADVRLGDSVAVNGVCLTASAIQENNFSFEMMPVTLRDTALGNLRVGNTVNLERAMPADGRFGGHFVSGHIDETGETVSNVADKNGHLLSVKIKPENKIFLVAKGSVAINGVSLTIQSAEENIFTVSLVGHTLESTALRNLRAGEIVNIEYDILAKYIQKMLLPAEEPRRNFMHKF